MLRFYYVGDNNRDVNCGLEGKQFRSWIGVGFLIKPPLDSNHFQMTTCYPHSKEGEIHIFKPTHKSWNRYSKSFGEALQCDVAVAQLHTFHMDLQPPAHVQLKNSNGRCLEYATFECHANFQINWEPFPHMDQQNRCVVNVALKSRRWQMSNLDSWSDSIVNQLRAHSYIWIDPKFIDSIASKLSTWYDIADLNLNKRSIVVETI
jgi:hypothetical protein